MIDTKLWQHLSTRIIVLEENDMKNIFIFNDTCILKQMILCFFFVNIDNKLVKLYFL